MIPSTAMLSKTNRQSFLPQLSWPFKPYQLHLNPKLQHYQPWLTSLTKPFLPSLIPPSIPVPELSPSPQQTAPLTRIVMSDCGEEFLDQLVDYDVVSVQHYTFSLETAVNPPIIMLRLLTVDMTSPIMFILMESAYHVPKHPIFGGVNTIKIMDFILSIIILCHGAWSSLLGAKEQLCALPRGSTFRSILL